jgi:hypothetical protein
MATVDVRPFRKLLRAVADLHTRGYQRLRIIPHFGGPGYWRCALAPAAIVSSRHGAMLAGGPSDLVANYTSAAGREYWGWADNGHCSPARLAEEFLRRHPVIADRGYGQDWLYAGWYQHMLHATYPDLLPVAFAEYLEADTYIALMVAGGGYADRKLALPPVGHAPDEQAQTKSCAAPDR